MPAIESLLAALAAPADLDNATPKKKSGEHAEFERAMTDALAPDEKFKAARLRLNATIANAIKAKTAAATTGENLPAVGESLSAANPPVKAATEKKVSAGAAPGTGHDLNAPPVAATAPVALPFVPPPVPPVPPASGKISAPGSTAGETVAAPIWAGTATTGPAKKLPAETDISLAETVLLNSLPTTSDEAAGRVGQAPRLSPFFSDANFPDANLPSGREDKGATAGPQGGIEKLETGATPVLRHGFDLVPEKNPTLVLTAAGRESVLQMDSPAAASGNDFSKMAAATNPAVPALEEQGTQATEGTKVAGPQIVMPELAQQENESFTGDFNRRAETNQTAAKSGTRVASTPPAMKNSDKMEVLAGFAGQKLPDAGPVRLAPGLITRSHAELPPRLSENVSGAFSTDALLDVATTEARRLNSVADMATHNLALPSLTETRAQAVERTHDLVSLHALRLVESKADSLSVVLKPDAGTELSLQLRQRNGVVEAQAVLTAGNHDLLSRNWAELQSRLELHGVKLSALGGELNANAGGNNFTRPRTPERDAETENALAFAEFSVATGGATARSAGLYGWESWA
jgi:hypothetical protein